MTQQDYAARRAKLVSDYNFLKRKRLYLSAKARIRMIADLDYEYAKIDKEETRRLFGYYDKQLNPQTQL